jgi:transcriptional regulator with XRE-family HTH domain
MPTTFAGRLSDLIRNRRQELKLTQQQVADVLGVTADFMSLVESGQRRLNLDHVALLAHALAIDPPYICRLALEERAPFFYAQLFADWESDYPYTAGGHA